MSTTERKLKATWTLLSANELYEDFRIPEELRGILSERQRYEDYLEDKESFQHYDNFLGEEKYKEGKSLSEQLYEESPQFKELIDTTTEDIKESIDEEIEFLNDI